MWVLVQPTEPTFNAGGSIHKFLLVPRDYVPEDFLPPELGVVEELEVEWSCKMMKNSEMVR